MSVQAVPSRVTGAEDRPRLWELHGVPDRSTSMAGTTVTVLAPAAMAIDAGCQPRHWAWLAEMAGPLCVSARGSAAGGFVH